MKHQTPGELQAVATVGESYPILSRMERLERWAEGLEREPNRRLFTLFETENQTMKVRDGLRRDDTPISVALEDPVLRASGMANDTYGEAKRFFELTDPQLHRVLCYCHFGETVSASAAARAVRAIITGREPGMFSIFRYAVWGA